MIRMGTSDVRYGLTNTMLLSVSPAASATIRKRSSAKSTCAAGVSGTFPLEGSLPSIVETNNRSWVSIPAEYALLGLKLGGATDCFPWRLRTATAVICTGGSGSRATPKTPCAGGIFEK